MDLFQGLSALFLPPMYLNKTQTAKFQPLALTYCSPPWTDDPGMKQYRFFFFSGSTCWNSLHFFKGISDTCERKGGAVGLHRGEVKCKTSAQQSLIGGFKVYSVCWSMLLGAKWMGACFHTFIHSQIPAALGKQPEGVNSSKLSIIYNPVAGQQVLTEKSSM